MLGRNRLGDTRCIAGRPPMLMSSARVGGTRVGDAKSEPGMTMVEGLVLGAATPSLV